MHQMQEEDPEFFLSIVWMQKGGLGTFSARMHNLIWTGVFGDVVVFDSTYRVNRYNLPFVPFIGVNHHQSMVVFDCSILSDDTNLSYVWLLEALSDHDINLHTILPQIYITRPCQEFIFL